MLRASKRKICTTFSMVGLVWMSGCQAPGQLSTSASKTPIAERQSGISGSGQEPQQRARPIPPSLEIKLGNRYTNAVDCVYAEPDACVFGILTRPQLLALPADVDVQYTFNGVLWTYHYFSADDVIRFLGESRDTWSPGCVVRSSLLEGGSMCGGGGLPPVSSPSLTPSSTPSATPSSAGEFTFQISTPAFSPATTGAFSTVKALVTVDSAIGHYTLDVLDANGSAISGMHLLEGDSNQAGTIAYEWNGQVNGVQLPDGAYKLILRSNAGEKSQDVTIDTQSPEVSAISFSDDTFVGTDGMLNISGSAVVSDRGLTEIDPDSVSVRMDSPYVSNLDYSFDEETGQITFNAKLNVSAFASASKAKAYSVFSATDPLIEIPVEVDASDIVDNFATTEESFTIDTSALIQLPSLAGKSGQVSMGLLRGLAPKLLPKLAKLGKVTRRTKPPVKSGRPGGKRNPTDPFVLDGKLAILVTQSKIVSRELGALWLQKDGGMTQATSDFAFLTAGNVKFSRKGAPDRLAKMFCKIPGWGTVSLNRGSRPPILTVLKFKPPSMFVFAYK